MRWPPASRLAAWLVVAQLAAGVAVAQVNDPRFASYFLVGQFGEVCTMCEVAVVCQPGGLKPDETRVPEGGDFTLYLLHTRTFWSQVSTIWEWFIANFTSASLAAGHERPVSVYEVRDGTWRAASEQMARISLEPARLAFQDGMEIDRVDRRWVRSGQGIAEGYCSRLPLWDTLAEIEARAPRGEAP